MFIEEDVCYRGHAHWGARMAGIGLGDGIDLWISSVSMHTLGQRQDPVLR